MMEGPVRGNVFLSHASGDKAFVDRVLHGLDRATTFYDTHTIQPGQATIDAMKSGVSHAAVFVLFHSAASQSEWVDWRNLSRRCRRSYT